MADAPHVAANRLASISSPTPLRVRSWVGFPAALPPIIGREQEIATVAGLLSQPEIRLLTLTGTGGVGKTRLAIAAAMECADSFVNGSVFVPLAAVRDHSLVLATGPAKVPVARSGR